jgi:hypothetical protein
MMKRLGGVPNTKFLVTSATNPSLILFILGSTIFDILPFPNILDFRKFDHTIFVIIIIILNILIISIVCVFQR